MGCGSSKEGLSHVDDSVHVMLKHDKKKLKEKGVISAGYVPRAEHPLMANETQDNAQRVSRPIATEDDDVVIPLNGN
jgi:hypothetical protein